MSDYDGVFDDVTEEEIVNLKVETAKRAEAIAREARSLRIGLLDNDASRIYLSSAKLNQHVQDIVAMATTVAGLVSLRRSQED